MKTAVVLYEAEHLALIDALYEKWRVDLTIISLDAEIDFALEKRGVSFVSGKTLQDRAEPSAYMRADEMIRTMCDAEELSFLTYRGISLMKPLRLPIHQYLQSLLYYIDVFDRCLTQLKDVERLVVPTKIVPISQTSASLAREEVNVVSSAAERVASARGVHFESYEVVTPVDQMKNVGEAITFAIKRSLFGGAMTLLSFVMALRSRRPIRLLATDWWKNIGPVLDVLGKDVEVLMLDRSEAMNAGWRNIWRYKMRFIHIDHFLWWRGKAKANAHVRACKEQWVRVRASVFNKYDLTFCGVDLRDTVVVTIDRLLEEAVADVVSDIEGTYAMYEKLTPNAVWLRASVSAQRHFAILPLVAKACGIPSLEVQHGGEYLGPGSPTREHPAEYIATYGKFVSKEFEALGYQPQRLIAAGSPRFDVYTQKKAAKISEERFTLLCVLSVLDGLERTTYDMEDYLTAVACVMRDIPQASVIVKLRPHTARHDFLADMIHRAFVNLPYSIEENRPIAELFEKTNVVVCNPSTVVYEATQYARPILISALTPLEKLTSAHFGPFAETGALIIAQSAEEMCSALKEWAMNPAAQVAAGIAGQRFVEEQFSFDGHAAERIAHFIRMCRR